jgi:calcyphosin
MTTLSNFLRGGEDLNARRKSVLNLAFSSMDKKGTGAIEPEVLLAVYKPSRHPDVISGKRSEESALQEFLTTFDVGVEVEGKVTQNEFENHYKRMSYSIPEDEVFETMIRELYGVSGRHGDDRHSAMNKLLSQKDADARLLSMHLKEYREQLLQAEQMSDNSKAVLSKLGSNNTSEISANVQQMNHNLINDDVSWPTDASSIATAIAGPDAASGSAPYPPRSAFPVPEVAVPAGVAHIIGKLKSRLRSSGVQGFVSLQRAIRSMDKHDKKRINMTDFKIAMKKVETGLSDSEVRMLFDYFNNEHRGSIDTENFVRKVRSALNDRRLILVKQAFAKLDLTGDGAVDVATVAGCYDSTSTPDVIAGRMTPENALLEFLGTFDVGGDIEGMVTIAEFINYYTNIGACVDNDEYFDLLVRNSWHVGGDRQEPSKKVFVTRKDGSQVYLYSSLSL